MSAVQSCCLSCAVHNDDLEELKNLLDSCVLSDSQASYIGNNLLRKVASWLHRLEKFLLEHDAEANSETESESETPLYGNVCPLCHAVKTESIQIMESMQNHDVDLRSHYYSGLLHMVTQLDNTEIRKVLLDHIDLKKVPLHCNKINNLQTVKSLLLATIDAKKKLYEDSIAFDIATQLATKEISNIISNPLYFGDTQLYAAAETNNTNLLQTLLQQNADVEARSCNNLTPLHIAARLGNTKSAEILLKHGANTNSVCASALCTLLDAAVRKGKRALVDLLLNKTAIMSFKNYSTLLHLAATRNHRAVVKLLLNNSLDINAQGKNNKNILRLAVERWNLPLIEQILEARSEIGKNKIDTQSDILEVLLQYGFTVGSEDTKDSNLLHYAVRRGHLKIVEYLLNLRTDCNAKCKVKSDSTPLHVAIAYNQIEIARLLIKNNADVNAKDGIGRTPLHYVLHKFDADNPSMVDIIQILLVSGAQVNEPNEDGKTALQIAADEGCEKVVELLLEHEADVNSVDERLETPLHSSARFGNTKIIKRLLDKGATVNAKRNDGATALHLAVRRGQTEPVKLLIEYGAEIGARDRFGVTPLHIAVIGYNSIIVKIFLNTCDDVDCTDKGGRTALHFAAAYGAFTFVRALLDHGADINLLCNDGLTPVAYSRSNNGLDCEWMNHINSDYYCGDSHNDSSIMACIELDEDLKETRIIFTEHIAKMTALSRWVNKQNLDVVKYNIDHYKHFVTQCAFEIECLKLKEIGPSNVLYYDILTKGMNSLTSYARNKYIVRALEMGEHKEMFPLYSAMLCHRFKKGQKRASLLDEIRSA